MKTMAAFGRALLAFLLAVLCAYLAAAVLSTQSVMSSLTDMGIEVTLAVRWGTTLHDLLGLLPTLMPLLAVALLLGFVVAGGFVRWQPTWRGFGFPLAGFLAIVVMHLLMRQVLELTPVAAARNLPGLLLQGAAGALGGYVYGLITTAGGGAKVGS
jgi:hypothetical protein